MVGSSKAAPVGFGRRWVGWRILLGTLGLLAAVSACALNQQQPPESVLQQSIARVSGTVTCRARIILPPDAYLRVELVDISRQGTPARTIAMREIQLGGRQAPIPFEITYNPATIDQGHTYAVQARILRGARLLFANDVVYKVLTNGVRSNVEVVVEPVPAPGGTSRRSVTCRTASAWNATVIRPHDLKSMIPVGD